MKLHWIDKVNEVDNLMFLRDIVFTDVLWGLDLFGVRILQSLWSSRPIENSSRTQENILAGPFGGEFLNFFLNGACSALCVYSYYALYFWAMVGPPNVAGPWVTYYLPPTPFSTDLFKQSKHMYVSWMNRRRIDHWCVRPQTGPVFLAHPVYA